MPYQLIKYYFGRVNLIAAEKDKDALLWKGLNSEKVLRVRDYNWGFFEIDKREQDEQQYYFGYLIKFRPSTDEEVAVTETHKLGYEEIQNLVRAKSRFFIHVKSGVIAYHPVGSEIKRKTFCDRFVKLFQTAFDNFFIDAEIQAIEERTKIFDAIKAFEKVRKVSIYLHPSNPRLSRVWEKTDQRLKKLRASKYHEAFEAGSNEVGLEMVNDKEIESKITMADDGYGKADITGLRDGKEKTVSTSDNPIIIMAPPDDEPAESVLEKLIEVFKDIFKRFR